MVHQILSILSHYIIKAHIVAQSNSHTGCLTVIVDIRGIVAIGHGTVVGAPITEGDHHIILDIGQGGFTNGKWSLE